MRQRPLGKVLVDCCDEVAELHQRARGVNVVAQRSMHAALRRLQLAVELQLLCLRFSKGHILNSDRWWLFRM